MPGLKRFDSASLKVFILGSPPKILTQALPILLTCLCTEILNTSKLEGKGALLNINENDTGSFNESIGDASLMNYFLIGGNSKRLPF